MTGLGCITSRLIDAYAHHEAPTLLDVVDERVALPDPGENRIGKFNNPATSGAPVTQRKAAILLYPKSGTQRLRVLDAIAGAGERGATDAENEVVLHGLHQGVSARRKELLDDGWIEDSGRERKTPSGAFGRKG